MKRYLLVVAILLFLAIVFAGYWLLSKDDRSEQLHYAQGETELVISNLANSTLTLYRAGKNLSDTSLVAEFTGKNIWLKPGNYFLSCAEDGRTTFIPVPLTGYRCGPDKNGSFLVTIRPMPKKFPPRLLKDAPEYVYIPSGNFLLGDRQNPREPHYVWLTGYFIAPFEVTNDEFREFLDAPDGYNDAANWTEQGRQWRSAATSRATALMKPEDADYKRFGQGDQPVALVSWFEANAFCKWLSRKYAASKWQFSLPTDAEWEKAARGPDNFDYGLSMFISDEEVRLYNWKKNPDNPVTVFGTSTTPSLCKPSRFGLYHITGNVVEWTQSTDRPFNREQPYGDDDRNSDNATALRTARGGSWYSAAISYMYNPYRDSFQPGHSTQDLGFRVVARALP